MSSKQKNVHDEFDVEKSKKVISGNRRDDDGRICRQSFSEKTFIRVTKRKKDKKTGRDDEIGDWRNKSWFRPREPS